MTQEWVVTYKMETHHNDPRAGLCDGVLIKEFFRGTEAQCREMAKNVPPMITPGDHGPWSIIVGPAKDWDDFLKDN